MNLSKYFIDLFIHYGYNIYMYGVVLTLFVVTGVALVVAILLQKNEGSTLHNANKSRGYNSIDIATKITIGLAIIFFVLALFSAILARRESKREIFAGIDLVTEIEQKSETEPIAQ